MKYISAFFSGLLFALGLGLAGMTKPSKVLGFLDLGGAWDPSLMFVMVGGILVYAPLYILVRRRAQPLFDTKFHVPLNQLIDRRLLTGAAIFGLGWGLGGYCPGPALTAAATGTINTLAFVGAMALSMFVFDRFGRRKKNH